MNKNLIFIEKSIKIHGNTYDYSCVNYVNNKTKVELICKEHGNFLVRPDGHFTRKQGCPKCGVIKRANGRKNKNWYSDFIKIHGDKYDYSKVIYENNKTKVEIICHKHGPFFMKPNAHINQKQGCIKCGNKSIFNKEDFIKESNKIHNFKFDYTISEYNGMHNKIKILCNDHGYFTMNAKDHIHSKQGCPKCKMSKGENKINNILTNLNIKFECQKTFSDCISENKLKFDFYLTEKNICIEYDGEQHFKPIEYFGGENSFNKLKERDNIKNEYCINNNIFLLRIPYSSYNDIENIIKKATK